MKALGAFNKEKTLVVVMSCRYRGNVDDPVLVADVGPLLRVVVLPGGGLQPMREEYAVT